MLVAPRKQADAATYGAHTDRKLTRNLQCLGEAPGVMPPFLMKHLLPTAILVHKEDLDDELPPLVETPVAIEPAPNEPLDREVIAEYRRLQALLLERIKSDRFVAGRAGKLLGNLVELPSYLDRSTADLGHFTAFNQGQASTEPCASASGMARIQKDGSYSRRRPRHSSRTR